MYNLSRADNVDSEEMGWEGGGDKMASCIQLTRMVVISAHIVYCFLEMLNSVGLSCVS